MISVSCVLPHAVLVSGACRLPHALQGLHASCSLPHGLAASRVRCSLPHALRRRLFCGCLLPHSLRSQVSVACATPHALATKTPTAASLSLPHAAYDPSADTAPAISVRVDGVDVELDSLELTADEESFALQAVLELASLEDWLRIAPDALLEIQIGEQSVQLLADQRTRSREFGSEVFSVSASSPASRLGAPHASIITCSWQNAAVQDIALELCAMAAVSTPLTLDWRICNWTLERFEVEAVTPLEALSSLVTKAARLVSAPDGALVVQYRYPQSPTRYAQHEPDITFSDYDDITRLEQESGLRPCYDLVQLFSEPPGSDEELRLVEWHGPDGKQDLRLPRSQRMVAAFAWPFETVQLETTGCESAVYDQGRYEFEHEEQVEFVDGQGSLSYPALELLEWSWRCEDLGGINASGSELQAEFAAPGCSLALVRYQSVCQLFVVESRTLAAVQVHASLQGDAEQSAQPQGLLVTVQRGQGERPSPESIVDPLCRSLAILRERGRNYLDDQGSMKELYDVVTPPRLLVAPGALAQVQDGSLHEKWRAKVTGWTLAAGKSTHWCPFKAESKSCCIRWQLERSVT